ncbi:FAD:protein FMN transferase [Clostridium sp. SHJSY1]|uniref:FAD:protein FMN transferase n=1 Tax=Clostridium sp. SHJSY1 TaxID=2942483 RepID=UPI0028763928|nr:FAD:protein FMN transferase [Clostridium sp. SHJSY1]MDS0524433.1 FAD:protein FMN transferase [Clostridium sp. SHJSY1]
MKKIIFILIISIVSILTCVSCSNNSKYYEKSDIVMDTTVTLSAYGKNSKEAVEESFKRLEEINQMASTNISDSDVYKINNSSGIGYVKVHPEILKMIETSIEYSELSGGAFDITLGPIINLWGIGTENERLPSDREIKEKLSLVGYKNITINKDDSSIMLNNKGMSVDLGGIAKGFAADEVLKIYKEQNIENGLINLGGSTIYALGKNKDSKEWSVGIKHPRSENANEYMGVISITNEALSTSGDYERYFIKDNKRYHHIIDPKTGYPSDNGAISDTVILSDDVSDKCMLTDILSTTVFILGQEKGLKLIEGLQGTSCEITTSDNKVYTSEGFKGRITDLNTEFKFSK